MLRAVFLCSALFMVTAAEAGECARYATKDGSTFEFVTADPNGPDQAVLLRLSGTPSQMCIYTAEDESGGTMLCSSGLTGETDSADAQSFTFDDRLWRCRP